MAEIEYSTSKAIYHTDKIKALQKGKQITPTEIQVDLEAYCNDNCSFCSYRKKDGYNNRMLKLIEAEPGKEYHEEKPIGRPSAEARIPLECAVSIPTQMVEAGIPAIEITGGGEPTLWPAFDKLIKNLMNAGREIGLVTNGSNLSEDRIKLLGEACTWIRVSMDSATPEIHRKIHRTGSDTFVRRIENIKKIAKYKNESLILGISFIITRENYKEIEDAVQLYSKIEGIHHIRFSWMYDKQGTAGFKEDEIEMIKRILDKQILAFSRSDFLIFYEKNRIEHYTEPNNFKTCYIQRFVWAIGADSKVYPCCIMKYHPDYAYADIRQMTLKEIVDDMATKQMMDSLVPAACFPCWLRNRNLAIEKAVIEPVHSNFI